MNMSLSETVRGHANSVTCMGGPPWPPPTQNPRFISIETGAATEGRPYRCGLLTLRIALVSLTTALFAMTGDAQPKLKDVFKDSFRIGVAINRAQFFEEDSRGVEII